MSSQYFCQGIAMNACNSNWPLALLCVCVSGCTPQIGYRDIAYRSGTTGLLEEVKFSESADNGRLKTQFIANPADGEFIYGIGRSSILFPAPAKAKGKDDEDQSSENGLKTVCPNEGMTWSDCLAETNPTVVAATTPDYVYAIRPSGGLYVKAIANSDPDLTQSLTFAYENPVIKEVSDTGPVIAAAYVVGGAPLAGAAVLLVAAEKYSNKFFVRTLTEILTEEQIEEKKAEDEKAKSAAVDFSKQNAICLPSRNRLTKSGNPPFPTQHQIRLPVSIKDNTTHAVSTSGALVKTSQDCWEAFPKSDFADTNRGWFYRIMDVDQPNNSLAFPPTYYAKQPIGVPFIPRSKITEGQQRFLAVPACRAVKLQVTWWENLYDEKYILKSGSYKEYQMAVADIDVMQMLSISKSERKFSLLSCGGYATAATGTTPTDTVGAALIKQVKDIHAAEQAFEKDK